MESVKVKLGPNPSGIKTRKVLDGYELREEVTSYIACSDLEKNKNRLFKRL